MNHPYKIYENSLLWETIKRGLEELLENQDLELTTREEYVVGFLCKTIIDVNLINTANNTVKTKKYNTDIPK